MELYEICQRQKDLIDMLVGYIVKNCDLDEDICKYRKNTCPVRCNDCVLQCFKSEVNKKWGNNSE